MTQIDKILGESAALWIEGPPGAGKTTLVASYLEHRECFGTWVQVDAAAADPATFFSLLKAADVQRRSRVQPLPHFTFEYREQLDTFARRFFERMWEGTATPSVLVLDNVQDIPPDAAIHQLICDAISRLPAQARVILMSRTAPPASYARLRMHRDLRLLRNDELRLTEHEALGIAAAIGGKKLQPEHVERLRHLTHGWLAGLILLLQQAQHPPSHPVLDDDNRELLFAYFAKEIFNRTDPFTQDVLVTSAVLPFFTPELICKLTVSAEAGPIIEELHERNYFVSRSVAGDQYQFHPLFQEFLRAQLLKLRTQSERRDLSHHAARLLESAGHGEEAFKLDVARRDWSNATRVLLDIAPTMAEHGRVAALQQYIAALPAQSGSAGAWLSYWTGVCQIGHAPRESYLHFERAFEVFGDSELTPRMMACTGAIDSVLLQWDEFASLDRWIDWINLRSPKELESLPLDLYAKCAESMTSALMFRRLDQENFSDWLERALSSAERLTGRGSRAALTFLGLSGFAVATGNLNIIDRVHAVVTSLSEYDATPLLQIARCYAEGARASLRGEFESAAQWMERGIDLSRHTGVSVWDHELLASATHIAMKKGDASASKAMLERSVAYFGAERVGSTAEQHFSQAWYALMTCNNVAALTHARRAVEQSRKSSGFPELICRYVLAEALFAVGDRAKATAELQNAQRIAEQRHLPHWVDSYMLLRASFALAEDDDVTAAQLLGEALPRIRERGCINRFGWLKREMTRVAACALRHGIEVSYVQTLVRQNPNLFESPHADVTVWPFPVKVFTLGRFAVYVDGSELQFATKIQKRPLELLKALIAFGGSNVPEHTVADLLWPDADGDAAAQALTTTLHRLRRLVGDDVVLRHGGRLTLNPARCWTDVASVEHTIQAIDRLTATNRTLSLTVHTRVLLELCQGAFLERDPHSEWIAAVRHRLERKVRRSLSTLARSLSRVGQQELARACERRARKIASEDRTIAS